MADQLSWRVTRGFHRSQPFSPGNTHDSRVLDLISTAARSGGYGFLGHLLECCGWTFAAPKFIHSQARNWLGDGSIDNLVLLFYNAKNYDRDDTGLYELLADVTGVTSEEKYSNKDINIDLVKMWSSGNTAICF